MYPSTLNVKPYALVKPSNSSVSVDPGALMIDCKRKNLTKNHRDDGDITVKLSHALPRHSEVSSQFSMVCFKVSE